MTNRLSCIMHHVSLLLILAACAASPPPGPFYAVLRWGETVERYRYERTAIAYGPDGGTTVVRESGMVVRPDRQYIKISSRAGTREEASEVLIVGDRAWVRQPILGRDWEATQPG